MLTVVDAARLAGRDPETIRRWIRAGRLRATRVGTRNLIDEADLDFALDEPRSLPPPDAWRHTRSGAPMPDWVKIIHRSREGR